MPFIPDADQSTVNSGTGRFIPDSDATATPTAKPFYDALGANMTPEMKAAHPVLAGVEQTAQDVATVGEKAANGLSLGLLDKGLGKAGIAPPNFDNTAPENKSGLNLAGDAANMSGAGKTIGTIAKPLIAAAAPIASKVGDAANTIKNNIARMALNPEFRSTASTVKYGQDAKRVMQSMPDVVGDDVHSTLDAVNNKLQETGKALGDTMDNHPNANVKLDASKSVLQPFTDKIAELNKIDPKGNAALIRRLNNSQQSLIKITDENGNVTGTKDLQNITAKDLFKFRQEKIDPRTRYTGNPSDDADVNGVFQEVKANVRDLLNKNMPELKPLNQDYGDLHAAGDALQKLSNKVDNEGLPSINWKDIATVGIHKWIANPVNRINMSRWLYTAPKAQVQQAANAIPGFTQGVKQSYGGTVNASLVSTPKGVGGPAA